jgi:hypothetical protein
MTEKPLDSFKSELVRRWTASLAAAEAAKVEDLKRMEAEKVKKLEEERKIIEQNEAERILTQERMESKAKELNRLALQYEAVSDEDEDEEGEGMEISVSELNRKRVADVAKMHVCLPSCALYIYVCLSLSSPISYNRIIDIHCKISTRTLYAAGEVES